MKKLSKVLLAISFVLSLTTSAFATTVTAVSWGGAYTESQKLGYGDPTAKALGINIAWVDYSCLLYTSPSPRDRSISRMPSSA